MQYYHLWIPILTVNIEYYNEVNIFVLCNNNIMNEYFATVTNIQMQLSVLTV